MAEKDRNKLANNATASSIHHEKQVDYICREIKKVLPLAETEQDKTKEPLVIKIENVKTSMGMVDLIEFHGFFIPDIVSDAIARLYEAETFPSKTQVEVSRTKGGMVYMMKFFIPRSND